MEAYNRGDYVPALRLFRPLAEQGNPKAQDVLGVMYRRGQGVARSPMRAFAWFSSAAARGDAKAKAELRAVSRTMTRDEVSQAREMAQACEASNYRNCEYYQAVNSGVPIGASATPIGFPAGVARIPSRFKTSSRVS